MGLFVGSKSASSASDPISLADLWQELNDSDWEGTWEENEYFNSGAAKLFLTIVTENRVHVKFSMFDTGIGYYTFSAWGTISGNTMKLKSGGANMLFLLSRESGALVLKGDYDVFSGPYVGETGSYYFKKQG